MLRKVLNGDINTISDEDSDEGLEKRREGGQRVHYTRMEPVQVTEQSDMMMINKPAIKRYCIVSCSSHHAVKIDSE